MKNELTMEGKIELAINEVRDAMLENVKASEMETEAVLRKKSARYKLQKAKERLSGLESELKSL